MNIQPKIHKVVLTGGPCGGKTTGQTQLRSFFENLGWKVFLVPEAASILIGGGIKFQELSPQLRVLFQENLLQTVIRLEDTFFRLARESTQNTLIILDRGAMDISAYISKTDWQAILNRSELNEIDLINGRYDQVIHLVTAALGAESFYTTAGHPTRHESIETARELDLHTRSAWVGHPSLTIIDNSTDFRTKMDKVIENVCAQVGMNMCGRFGSSSRKLKFLLQYPHAHTTPFPLEYRDFCIIYDYLSTSDENVRARLRKRGFNGHWTYTHTIRRPVENQSIEVKTTINSREYCLMLTQRDTDHLTVYITRRCFLWNGQYFQMDIYERPCHQRCENLVLLETYTSLPTHQLHRPPFLPIESEVTGNPRYSMFNLSLGGEWENNGLFSSLASSRSSDFTVNVSEANNRPNEGSSNDTI